MRERFWRDRNVLVTGHTGFKGAWLSIWLQSLGARVTGYSLPPPTDPSLFEVCGVAGRIAASHTGDIRDLDLLKRAPGSCSLTYDASGASQGPRQT